MRAYFIDDKGSKESYKRFMAFMISYSEAFSVVYFRYNENEPYSHKVKKIRNLLEPYLIYTKNTNKWPGTFTLNQPGHIYDLAVYRTDYNVVDAILSADSIWDWDYPDMPMDLCFYKNDFCWFALSVHEHWNLLYTEDETIPARLCSMGLNVELAKENVPSTELYYDNMLRWNYQSSKEGPDRNSGSHVWKDVSCKNDIVILLNETNCFHDSCIKEMYYVSGAYVDTDYSMHPVNYKRELHLFVQLQIEEKPTIELVFSEVSSIQLNPVSQNYTCEISGVTIIEEDGLIYWVDDYDQSIESINGYTGTVICARNLKYRFLNINGNNNIYKYTGEML